jgi:hypothetical protein
MPAGGLDADYVDDMDSALSIKMSRDVRAAEPIHVTRTTMAIASVGFALWGIGWIMLWLVQTGTGLEWSLLTIGALFIAVAAISHVAHLRVRFGLAAVVLLLAACAIPVVLFLPFALEMTLGGNLRTYAYALWGVTWLTASLGVFLVLARKEARLERRDRSPRTEIHASFFQLTLVAVGMLIYGISFLGMTGQQDSYLMGWLSLIGPSLIAIALISHIEHLSLRVGRPAVILAIVGVAIWAGKNITRATTDLMSDPEWSAFLVNGLQGISMMLGAIACLLVVAHKQTWVESAVAGESEAQVTAMYDVLDDVRNET